MTLERVFVGIAIIIGILLIIFGAVGYFYWNLVMHIALLLIGIGAFLIFITIVIYFLLL